MSADRLLSVEEARAAVFAAIDGPTEPEVAWVLEALGRVAAEPVASPIALPPWSNSAMDGYAIRAADTTGAAEDAPVRLEVTGEVRHGEAVAYGMLVAAEIAVTRGTLPSADRDALAALVAKMGPLPAVADVAVPELLEAIGHDKKVIAGQLHFVLPTSIGSCDVVTDVTREEIADAFTRLRAL